MLPPVAEIHEVYVTPPAGLLDCEPAPEIPADDVLMTWTQRDVARNYVLTWRAGEDCRQALQAVKDYLRDTAAARVGPPLEELQ